MIDTAEGKPPIGRTNYGSHFVSFPVKFKKLACLIQDVVTPHGMVTQE
jgi:hypothetical protein